MTRSRKTLVTERPAADLAVLSDADARGLTDPVRGVLLAREWNGVVVVMGRNPKAAEAPEQPVHMAATVVGGAEDIAAMLATCLEQTIVGLAASRGLADAVQFARESVMTLETAVAQAVLDAIQSTEARAAGKAL